MSQTIKQVWYFQNILKSLKSIDVVYLFDFFHELEKPDPILYEINRVLKENGILSLYDPLMKEKNIITKVTNKNSFKYFSKGSKTYSFIKI
ncbi:MAG: class I SAM-dependent methyltransferase [Methanosarcinales archaeon]|nr:class I SAM-dependent methyltransferase [Methanosarcinales archaeon]